MQATYRDVHRRVFDHVQDPSPAEGGEAQELWAALRELPGPVQRLGLPGVEGVLTIPILEVEHETERAGCNIRFQGGALRDPRHGHGGSRHIRRGAA